MSTLYASEDGACPVWIDDNVIVAGEAEYEARRPRRACRRRIGAIAKNRGKAANRLPPVRSLGDYLATGVTAWVCRMAYEKFRSHEERMELLTCAWLVQEARPTLTPKQLWCRALKDYVRSKRNACSLGMTGRGSGKVCRVDADSAIRGVAASVLGVQEAYLLAEEREADGRMLALIVTLLGDLGQALQDGETMEQAAQRCGIALRTAYARVDKVRTLLDVTAA